MLCVCTDDDVYSFTGKPLTPKANYFQKPFISVPLQLRVFSVVWGYVISDGPATDPSEEVRGQVCFLFGLMG